MATSLADNSLAFPTVAVGNDFEFLNGVGAGSGACTACGSVEFATKCGSSKKTRNKQWCWGCWESYGAKVAQSQLPVASPVVVEWDWQCAWQSCGNQKKKDSDFCRAHSREISWESAVKDRTMHCGVEDCWQPKKRLLEFCGSHAYLEKEKAGVQIAPPASLRDDRAGEDLGSATAEEKLMELPLKRYRVALAEKQKTWDTSEWARERVVRHAGDKRGLGNENKLYGLQAVQPPRLDVPVEYVSGGVSQPECRACCVINADGCVDVPWF